MAFIADLALMSSCASTSKVSFTEADHYHFRNDVKTPSSVLRITSKEQLESYFGYAAVMGKNGLPTHVDFSRQFVLAKVLPITNVYTEIKPVSLEPKDGKLIFTYEVKHGKKQSSSIQPMTLVIVDRKYVNYEVAENAK